MATSKQKPISAPDEFKRFWKLPEEFPSQWTDLRSLKALKDRDDGELIAEIAPIVYSREGMVMKRNAAPIIEDFLNTGYECNDGLGRLLECIDNLTRDQKASFKRLIKTFAKARGLSSALISLAEFRADILALIDDIEFFRIMFGASAGIKVLRNLPHNTKRKKPTEHFSHPTILLMGAWRRLTGKPVNSAKGFSKPSALPATSVKAATKLPNSEDAFFVYTCLSMIFPGIDASSVITTINKARRAEAIVNQEKFKPIIAVVEAKHEKFIAKIRASE